MKTTRTTSWMAAAVVAASLSGAAHAVSPAQWQAMRQQWNISLEQAVQNATRAVPGDVIEVELEPSKSAGARYEVQVLTPAGESVEVWVDAASGQARPHAQDGKAKRKDLERLQQARINLTQAVQAAQTHTPGQAVKAELDNHWGTTTYQVDVLQPDNTVMEIKVDAANGQILRAKKD